MLNILNCSQYININDKNSSEGGINECLEFIGKDGISILWISVYEMIFNEVSF